MCQDLRLDHQLVFTCFMVLKPLSHSALEAEGQDQVNQCQLIRAGMLMGPVDTEPEHLLQGLGLLVHQCLRDSPLVRDPFNMDARDLQDRLEVVQCHQNLVLYFLRPLLW